MREEMHLFIIWSNALYKKTEIIEDIKSRFDLLGMHTITWEKSHFSSNLTRFYGENLPPHSNKERMCGNGAFLLLVVCDKKPLYRKRVTSKGVNVVNVNMFDAKEMYRNWTGGGHMVHGTNSEKEFKHDIVLLTGLNKTDYRNKAIKSGKILTDEYSFMPGENKWDSINQVLYVLNETIDYVVLRNFNGLFSSYETKVHGDIDILTPNRDIARQVLNAIPVHVSKRRVQHIIRIGQGGVYVDIRYVGDGYYCKEWEEAILMGRFLTTENYYRPQEEDYIYALLYHALVQKKRISQDYRDVFKLSFPKMDVEDDLQLFKELDCFLESKKYKMTEPYDYSVYFNKEYTRQRMSPSKFVCKVVARNHLSSAIIFPVFNLFSLDKGSLRKILHLPLIHRTWHYVKNGFRYLHKIRTGCVALLYYVRWSLFYRRKEFQLIQAEARVDRIKPYKPLRWKFSTRYYWGNVNGKNVFIKTDGRVSKTSREKNTMSYVGKNSDYLIAHIPALFESPNTMIIEAAIQGKALDCSWNILSKKETGIIEQLFAIYNELKRIKVRHLDLRPANFIFDEGNDTLYLIDFGYSIVDNMDLYEGIKKDDYSSNVISKLGSDFSARDGSLDDAYSMLMTMKHLCPSLMSRFPRVWQELNEDIGENAVYIY